LSIRNISQLSNGSAVSLVLDRRGAMVGRAATADWCLPDPTLHLSSRHFEVRFADGRYDLIDHSTNGTFLYGQATRLSAAHVIQQGDVFVVGPYEIVAALDDASAAAADQRNQAPAVPQWQGWGAAGKAEEAAPSANLSAWGRPPDQAAISGAGPLSQSWAPPAVATGSASSAWDAAPAPPPPATPAGSAWDTTAAAPATEPAWEAPPAASPWNTAPPPALQPASEWSSGPAPASAPTGNDIWGAFAQSNVVDWARGGFGTPPAAPTPAPPAGPPPPAPTAFGAPAPATPQSTVAPSTIPPPPPSARPPAPLAADPAQTAALLAAAGIEPDRIKRNQTELAAQAGTMLRQLVAGLVVMLEARARAKSQMGAQGTNLEFDGNNPLKFARTPEQALVQMLNPPERGFMGSDRAIEDAFKDLQAHQVATLKAMQGALRATLERFSPAAIRARAEGGGLLRKIMPGAREAALWAAYEKEFQGVAIGSDEAFMDMFAKEFRIAYEELSARR
jgi:type VI secretion system FHA domain protein